MIGPQSPAKITLRHEDGKEDIIQRQEIKNTYVTNPSAMPGDHLLEYLKTVR